MEVNASVGVEVAGAVTNELNNEVGVAVSGGVGVAVALTETISLGVVSATGKSMIGLPPMGVGVSYCPHNDVLLPPHEERMKVARIKMVVTRFTAGIIPSMDGS